MFVKYTPQLISLTIGFLFTSCYNFYKVTAVSQPNATAMAAKLDSLTTTNRYLILRNGSSEAFRITNVQWENDKKTAILYLDSVAPGHVHYLSGQGANMRYKKSNAYQLQIVNEAHVYVPYNPAIKIGVHQLPLNEVQRIETIQPDTKRSTNSHVLGTLGVVFGTLAIGAVIVFSTISYD